MDTSQLRICFLDLLRNIDSRQINQFNNLHPGIMRYASERGFIAAPQPLQVQQRLPTEDTEKVRELFWSFIIQGIIMPGANEQNPNLPFFTLTEYGRMVVANKDPVPHDPDSFLVHIKRVAPNLDEVALFYLAEGLECFQRGTYTASVVMLGVASEKLIFDLAESVQNALTGNESDNLLRVIEIGRISRIYEETMKRLSPRINKLPTSMSDGLESQIDGVFTTIRTHRNQAGHPSGNLVDRLTALGLYSSFPFYCGRVSELIGHINANGL